MQFSYFSPEMTEAGFTLNIFVGIFTIIIFIFGYLNYRFFFWRFFALAFGVFCFEGLTGALWNISGLGDSLYFRNDLSFIMTLLWTNTILSSKFIYNRYVDKKTLLKEFAFVIFVSSCSISLLLTILFAVGIIDFSLALTTLYSEAARFLHSIIYIPIFSFVTYSFLKYWELAMYNKFLFQDYTIYPQKDFGIAIFSIGALYYLIHPLLIINGPYYGISMMVGVLCSLTAVNILIHSIKNIPLLPRYIIGVSFFATLVTFLLDFFVKNNYINFHQSVYDTHSIKTINFPGMSISDIEFVGIMLFSFLLIAIVKYFKIIFNTKGAFLGFSEQDGMTFKGWKSIFN